MGLFSNKSKKLQQQAQGEMDKAQAFERQQYQDKLNAYTPYNELGKGMFTKFKDYFDKGGTEFDPNSVQMDPGYGFREKQGMNAIQNSAMARGGLMSGNTLRATQDYGQQLASQEYGNAYNRTYGAFKDKYNLMSDMRDYSEKTRDQYLGVKAEDPTGREHLMKAQQLMAKASKAGGFAKTLGSIGSIAGTAFGGPLGGMAGGALGSMLGGGGSSGMMSSGLSGLMGGGGGGAGGLLGGLF